MDEIKTIFLSQDENGVFRASGGIFLFSDVKDENTGENVNTEKNSNNQFNSEIYGKVCEKSNISETVNLNLNKETTPNHDNLALNPGGVVECVVNECTLGQAL